MDLERQEICKTIRRLHNYALGNAPPTGYMLWDYQQLGEHIQALSKIAEKKSSESNDQLKAFLKSIYDESKGELSMKEIIEQEMLAIDCSSLEMFLFGWGVSTRYHPDYEKIMEGNDSGYSTGYSSG